jgi:type IV pilus assembly protein PilF
MVTRAVRWGLAVMAVAALTAACGGGRSTKRQPQDDLAQKVRLAQGYLRAGRVGPALQAAQEAIALDPKNADLYNLEGQVYFMSGRYPEAEEAFKKALELDPHFTDVHNTLGALYSETGRPAEAERELRLALEDHAYPTPEKVYLNLGVLYASQGRDDEAISMLRKAVEIAPEYYQAHYQLASVLDRQGKLEEAAREYEVAQPDYRNSGEYHYRLGLVYFRLGDQVKAADHLRRVLDLAPGSESAVRADEVLKTIP